MKAIRSSVACLAVLSFMLSFAATAEEQTPFKGAPMLIPGQIEAEDFDNGGEGIAYHDTDVGNNGGYYRATDVDLAQLVDLACCNRQKPAYIGWTRAGEWLEYTVDVQQEGYYFVEVGVSSYRPGGTFHIAFDGIDKTGPLTVPDTGGWHNWRVVAKAAVYLHAGTQVMSLVMDSNGISGSVANIDDIDFFPSVAFIPGTVQAERFNDGGEGVAYHDTDAGNNGSYYRAADVDVDVDRNNPFYRSYIGWTKSGEWVEYAVNVWMAGYYTVEAFVASQGQGGTFHIEFNGVDATGMFTVPDTGGWRKWERIRKSGVYLTAGTQVMRLVMHDTGPSGSIGNIDLLTIDLQQRTTIPGGVAAVDFNQGGEGIAYHDVDPVNLGGHYRQDGVDIDLDLVGSIYYVGWTEAGEWLAYTVDVLATGYYRFEVVLASNGRGGTFHIEFDGVDKTGTFAVPDTGGWRQWERLNKENIFLTAGTYTMRIVMDTNGTSGSVANIRRVDVRNAGLPFTFNGAPAEIPGRIEAEDFDPGGEGVSYHDTGPGNNGLHYRDTGVDIDRQPLLYQNYYVGWTAAGEWLNYSVNVATPGSFLVEARVASAGQGGTFHIELDGVDVTGDFNVPDTGGWRNFVSLSKTGVYLSAGPHVMRIALDSIGPSGSVANLDYLRIIRE